MGVYFYFYNWTTGEKNTKPLKYNSGLHWIPKFTGDIEIFQYVIDINGWDVNDQICACGDNNTDLYIYENGVVTYEYYACHDSVDQVKYDPY